MPSIFQVRLVCSAQTDPDHLFATSDSISDGQKHFARVLIGDLDISVVSSTKYVVMYHQNDYIDDRFIILNVLKVL